MTDFIRLVLTVVLAGALIACGGGGGSGSPGVISGMLTTPTATADYTITAQNAGGSTTFKLSIVVITVTATPANLQMSKDRRVERPPQPA
jgi:hypothetical protein